MRDTRRIQERVEFRLDRLQMIWLTLGGVVAMAVMFALGVVVGRRAARLETVPAADRLAQLDADGAMHKELTFYSRLTARDAADPLPPKLPPPPPVAKQPAPPPAVAAPAQVVAAVPPPADAPVEIVEDADEKPKAPVVLPSVPKPAAPAPVVAAAAVKPEAPKAAAKPQAHGAAALLGQGPAHAGDYTVQVSAFQSVEEAKAYASSLERRGFKPFVVSAPVKGKGTWYRVRIGSFPDQETAAEAKNLLARADIPAWVLKSE